MRRFTTLSLGALVGCSSVAAVAPRRAAALAVVHAPALPAARVASPAAPVVAAARARLVAATASPRIDHAQLDHARALAVEAIRVDAASAEAHLALGLVDAAAADYGAALASLDRARRLDPGLAEAHRAAGELRLRLRAYPAAAAAFRDLVAARPDDYDARVGLSAALRGVMVESEDDGVRGRALVGSRAAVDAALKLAPGRAEAWLSSAELALASRDPAEVPRAEDALTRFIALTASSPALAERRDYAEARLRSVRDATRCTFGAPPGKRIESTEDAKRRDATDELTQD